MNYIGRVVSDKKIIEIFILKTYFLTPWPTYATNKNQLKNVGKGPPSDNLCRVWLNSHYQFMIRSLLKFYL